MFNIKNITRKNILGMKPYSAARDEFKGIAKVWLDANENPNETNLNRYPDPQQKQLKTRLAYLKDLNPEQVFIGNGSDEAIDLLFRAFCEPGIAKAFIFPPTYGMYEVSAAINNVDIIKLPVQNDFSLPPVTSIKSQLKSTGLLFICSPNNPTGNVIDKKAIREMAANFYGLVVVDEAYIDFSKEESAISLLNELPNLVILQTFSKAWGLAGLRVGMAFASKEIIGLLNKIKPPYNVNTLSQAEALKALSKPLNIETIIKEREILSIELEKMENVIKVFPSEANFLLVKFEDSETVFKSLLKKGIVLRNRTDQIKGSLRISIGTPDENALLLSTLKEIKYLLSQA